MISADGGSTFNAVGSVQIPLSVLYVSDAKSVDKASGTMVCLSFFDD
jgi:hypothetical protein